MNLDFLRGKVIVDAFYTPDKKVVTLHFDDETLYGWASGIEHGKLSDCGPNVISFEEADGLEREIQLNKK